MPKTVAYCALHYGKDYLPAAIGAVAPHVEEVWMLYTPSPSYGHAATAPCPESREALREVAMSFANVRWADGLYRGEGEHRAAIARHAPDAETIVVFDADEVWEETSLLSALAAAREGKARRYGIQGFVHFWRSFSWACRDVWTPIRIVCPRAPNVETQIPGTIYHFGYAQSEALTRYKWDCHGHKSELRPEWLSEKFLANAKTDIHPTTRNWWTAEPFDKRTLPASLRTHPFYDLEVIR